MSILETRDQLPILVAHELQLPEREIAGGERRRLIIH